MHPRIIQTRQVVALTQTILFKFCLKSADILPHLHILFWLTDFLLPKCCHESIITQPIVKSIYHLLKHIILLCNCIFNCLLNDITRIGSTTHCIHINFLRCYYIIHNYLSSFSSFISMLHKIY